MKWYVHSCLDRKDKKKRFLCPSKEIHRSSVLRVGGGAKEMMSLFGGPGKRMNRGLIEGELSEEYTHCKSTFTLCFTA